MATHMGNDVNAGPPFPPQGLILDEDGDPLALDVNPAGYPGAHFATWPPKLVRPLILAGTSQAGACAACGSPWVRVVEPTGHVNRREPAHVPGNSPTKTDSTGWGPTSRGTDRWSPSCKCGTDDTQPCRVLDIFAGAGTTLLVADQLGRDAIGIDLQTDYVSMAVTRVHDDAPLFAAVTVETERQLPLTERTS